MTQTLPERDVRILKHSLSVLEGQLEQAKQLGHPFLCPPTNATATATATADPTADPTATANPNANATNSNTKGDADVEATFTLADVFVYQELFQLAVLVPQPDLNGNLKEGHPHIAQWMERMARMPRMEETVAPLRKFATDVAKIGVDAEEAE